MAYRPRKIPPTIPLEDAEDETLYTRAALNADPDAQDLLIETDDWMPLIDAVRLADRQTRGGVMEALALRTIAGAKLDLVSEAFADDLYLGVNKDRTSIRWIAFFPKPVSLFLRQPLGKQVKATQGWLSVANDKVLEDHRASLTAWCGAADTSMIRQKEAAMQRGAVVQARADMADALTKERDALFELLAARARAKGLPREWPQSFFRVGPSRGSESEEPAQGEKANEK